MYIYIHIYTYIYMSYINQLIFFLHFSRAGTVHTPGTEACHTCIAFCILQLVGWQAWCHPGSAAVGECLHQLPRHTHTHTHTHLSSHPYSYNHTSPLQPGTSLSRSCLDDIRVGAGSRVGPTSFKWNNKSSAARLCGACRDGQEMGVGWDGGRSRVSGGCCRVQMEGVGSSPGLQTDSWMGGRESFAGGGGEGGKARKVSANFMTITFVFNFFSLFFSSYVIFFCCCIFALYLTFYKWYDDTT